MKNKHHKAKVKKFPTQRFIKVTVIYFLLFLAISGMIDYYALMAFNFLWFLALSIIIAVPAGYYHVKTTKHDHTDDIADEFL
jgi:uncharacterized membrane protein